jgi:hypothetical protein
MARVNCDLKYKSYRNGYLLDTSVADLLRASVVDLSNGGGLQQFEEYLLDYKIIVYGGFSPDRLIFNGMSVSHKKIYLLYYADSGHFNVITNVKVAMVKGYICN